MQPDEDEHVNNGRGWCRELWLDSLGLGAVVPPAPETGHGWVLDDDEGADERKP